MSNLEIYCVTPKIACSGGACCGNRAVQNYTPARLTDLDSREGAGLR